MPIDNDNIYEFRLTFCKQNRTNNLNNNLKTNHLGILTRFKHLRI